MKIKSIKKIHVDTPISFYDITVDDKVYHLHPASTPEEELQQERDRLEIIKFLLHDAINIMLENTINNNDESEFLTPDPFSLIYKLNLSLSLSLLIFKRNLC